MRARLSALRRPLRPLLMAAGGGIAFYLAAAYGVLPMVWWGVERDHHPALASMPKVTV